MKQHNQIYRKLTAATLLVGLLLQSCNNLTTSVIPSMEVPTHSKQVNQESIVLNLPNQLVAKELTASEGYVVTLHQHEEEGQWLADVEVHASAGFTKNYHDFSVYVNENTDLAQVLMLGKQQQRQLVEVKLPTKDQSGYVYIGPRGLLGGMRRGVIKKGDEGEEKEKEKEEEKEYAESKPYESPKLSGWRMTRRPTSEQKEAITFGSNQSSSPSGWRTIRKSTSAQSEQKGTTTASSAQSPKSSGWTTPTTVESPIPTKLI